jgi:Mrp family chromosome partitioning ATPase
MLHRLAPDSAPGGTSGQPEVLRAEHAAVASYRTLHVLPLERGRARREAVHRERQISQALTDLMRQLCLGKHGVAPARSVVFVPVAPTADVDLLTATAAKALATHVSEPVCLVDANLRVPSLHDRFGIVRAPGVSDLLVHRSMPVPIPLSGNCSLMPAGTCCLEASQLVAGERGRRQLRRLMRRFAHTVILAPSLVESTDGSLLGSLADGVVLIVNQPSMRTDRLAALARGLESAGARVVGAVLHTPKSRLRRLMARWL